MELYLDSANLDHIRKAHSLGVISGVTTNPSLLAKEDPKIDIKRRILDIHKLVGGHLSVEVISTDTKGMLHEAEEIIKWFPDATIKIPMIPAGLSAVRYLSDNGIPTNVTLIFTANQAIAAQNAGASYVSVFMGRLDDISFDSSKVLEEIGEIWDIHNYDSAIISASIRNPLHITQSALAGAHIATVPYNVLMQSLYHPLTDAGVKKFLEDNAKLQDEIRRLKAQNNAQAQRKENINTQSNNQNQANNQSQSNNQAQQASVKQAVPQDSKVEAKKEEKPAVTKQDAKIEAPLTSKQEPVKQDTKSIEAKPTEAKANEAKVVETKAEETKKVTSQAEKPQAPKKQSSSSTKKASTAKKEIAKAEKTTVAKKESKAKTSSAKKKGEK